MKCRESRGAALNGNRVSDGPDQGLTCHSGGKAERGEIRQGHKT